MTNILTGIQKHGLYLSQKTNLAFPDPSAKKNSSQLLDSLSKIFRKPSIISADRQSQLIVKKFHKEYLLIGLGNLLAFYEYNIHPRTQQLSIELLFYEILSQPIINIHTRIKKQLNMQGQMIFILQLEGKIQLGLIDLYEKKIKFKNQIKIQNIQSILFQCQSQIILLNSTHIYQIIVQQDFQKIAIRKKYNHQIQLESEDKLLESKVYIVNGVSNKQDSEFRLIYFVIRDKQTSMKVNEFERDQDRQLSLKQKCTCVINRQGKKICLNKIIPLGQYICLYVQNQIAITKKKFDNYLLLDCVIHKDISNKCFRISEEGFIISTIGNSCEVSYLNCNDPKSNIHILDEILLDQKQNFLDLKQIFYVENSQEPTLLFFFYDGTSLQAMNLIKRPPLEKLRQLLDKRGKQDIVILQQIANNLGVSNRDFYIDMWAHSKRQLGDIHTLLLKCGDIHAIKKELHRIISKKSIQVSEYFKIIDKISQMLCKRLQSDLNIQILKQYVKNAFLKRKLKFLTLDAPIDSKGFQVVHSQSLLNLFIDFIELELFPKEKPKDHFTIVQQNQLLKGGKNLKQMFHQFKITLLENYKDFIEKLVRHFGLKSIEVIKHFSDLLPKYPFKVKNQGTIQTFNNISTILSDRPNHLNTSRLSSRKSLDENETETQKSVKQNIGFTDITKLDWEKQVYVDKIKKMLHQFYPSSTVSSCIQRFLDSDYGKRNMYQTFTMIRTSPSQFQSRYQNISGVKLYYFVCQIMNQQAIKAGQLNFKNTELMKVFEKKLNLCGQELEKCRLFSEMHYVLVKNKIVERKISIEQLIEMNKNPQHIVSMFFLGNVDKYEYLFTDFRAIYFWQNDYNQVMSKFVSSQICSKIQLRILFKEIIKKGSNYQCQNQKLIKAFIEAFCQKIQIRQTYYAQQFLQLIGELEVDKYLGMFINKIAQIIEYKSIFTLFNWEKKTFEEILRDSKNTLRNLMDSYFTEEIRQNQIVLKQETFALEYPRNMLNVLLYLKETIFYDITESQILYIYVNSLIQWKMFDVIDQLLSQSSIFELLSVDQNEFIETIIKQNIDAIYQDKNSIWDEQVRQQIMNILALQSNEDSSLLVRQFAKVELIQVFKSWGFDINLHQIHILSVCWSHSTRVSIIKDVIDNYLEHMSFTLLSKIYGLMQIVHRKSRNIHFEDSHFMEAVQHLCEKMYEKQKYDEVVEMISYIKSFRESKLKQSLVTGTLLKVLEQNYPRLQDREVSKKIIQHYIFNFNSIQGQKQLFESKLKIENLKDLNQSYYILVDTSLLFAPAEIEISFEDIWRICVQAHTSTLPINQFYFSLCLTLKQPNCIILEIQNCQSILEELIAAYIALEKYFESNALYWNINFEAIYKLIQNGLYRLALSKVSKQTQPDRLCQAFYERILKALKLIKHENLSLVRSIIALQTRLQYLKNAGKKQRYENKNRDIKRSITFFGSQQEEQQPQPNPTLKYKQLIARKNEFTGNNLPQKQSIQQVYEQFGQNRVGRNNNNTFASLLSMSVGVEKSKIQKQTNIIDLITNNEFDTQTHEYNADQILQALQNIYRRPSTSFKQNLQWMKKFKTACPFRIKLGQDFSKYSETITNDDLKQIFSFNFFVKPIKLTNEQYFGQSAYVEVSKTMGKYLAKKQLKQIMNVANMFAQVLNNPIYKTKVCMLGVEGLGLLQHRSFKIMKTIKDLLKIALSNKEFFLKQIKKLANKAKAKPQFYRMLEESLRDIPKLPKEVTHLIS